MARGKSLDDSELRVVVTDIEEGNIPYFIIDRKYGIACDSMNEILVVKKVSKRTNSDNPDDPYIEQYVKWEAIGYYRLFSDALIGYMKDAEKDAKSKLPKSLKGIGEVLKIQKEIYSNIHDALDIDNINHDFIESLQIFDERQKLKDELAEIRKLKSQVRKETEELLELIAEKRRIIIKK